MAAVMRGPGVNIRREKASMRLQQSISSNTVLGKGGRGLGLETGGLVGVDGVCYHGVVGEFQVIVKGLDVCASTAEVGADKAVPPLAGGVVVGEVAVAKLVDEIRRVLEVGKGFRMGCFERFEHFVLEHQIPISFRSFEQL